MYKVKFLVINNELINTEEIVKVRLENKLLSSPYIYVTMKDDKHNKRFDFETEAMCNSIFRSISSQLAA